MLAKAIESTILTFGTTFFLESIVSSFIYRKLPLLIFLAASVSPTVQGADKVFAGKNVTESALIEALTPAPEGEDAGPRTRSIRVMRDSEPRNTSGSTPKSASASLLITFETNSADLTRQAKQSLDVVGRALSSERLADFRFAVEGHADPRGDPSSNMELSKQRAESVRQYLVQNQHIEDRRLEAIGKGDKELMNVSHPFAPENRRVTIVNLSQ
ncbi:MAG: hypothetical protein NVSMB6_11330 [Burkholderiaceae bacterium]